MCSSLERLVEADGGGAVEDDVDAGGELLHILWADGQARLHQLAADGDDLLVEVWVVLPHSVKKLPDTRKKRKEKKKNNTTTCKKRKISSLQTCSSGAIR